MSTEVVVKDNSALVLRELGLAAVLALEEIGLRAEGYAKMKCPVGTPESTGIEGYVSSGLRQSISHKVVNHDIYIGTNKKYAQYVELGTGIYATDGNGRKSPWTWYDKNGKPHFTHGMRPHHFLRDAAGTHNSEYKRVIEKYMK